MVTVDLSGLCTAKRLFPGADIELYAWGHTSRYAYGPGELAFEHKDILEHFSEYLSADLRIIWGDFSQAATHWRPRPDFWDGDAPNLTPEDAARIVFLTDASEDVLKRTFAFGGTTITNEAANYTDLVYRAAFDRFFTHSGGIFMRDALSAAKISPLQQGRSTLGADCALMLRPDDLHMLPEFHQPPSRSGLGVFFGRSPNRRQLMKFSRKLGQAVDRPTRWIPWFWSDKKTRILARIEGYKVPNSFEAPGKLLSDVAACEFVVTDTYHLCVNAWRMGIPAICIGVGAGSALDSLADKKKEVLYEMYEARQFYVFLEELTSRAGWQVALTRCAEALRSKEQSSFVHQRIMQHVAATERRLTATARAVTGSD